MALSQLLGQVAPTSAIDHANQQAMNMAQQQMSKMKIQSAQEEMAGKRRAMAVSMLNGIAQEQDPMKQQELYSKLAPMAMRYDPTLGLPDQYDPSLSKALTASQISPEMQLKMQMNDRPEFKVVGNQVVQMNPVTGEVLPVYNAPFAGAVDPMTGQPNRKLSSVEQKELFETMDLTNSGEAAKGALSKARSILTSSPQGAEPYTGFGAETRAAASRLPVIGDVVADKERGAATTEYKTLVTEQALNSLKAIFGGMPTEGERQILMQMQALPTYTPQEQERILANAEEAAARRIKFNQVKVVAINSGNYRGMSNNPAAPASQQELQPGDIEDGYVFMGGDPADPKSWKAAR